MLPQEPYRDVLRADPCAYCGAAGGTLDHIVALAIGGTNHWSNLSGACASCNHAKDSRPLIWFLFGLKMGMMPPRRFAGMPRRLRPEIFDVPPLRWPLAEPLLAALGLANSNGNADPATTLSPR